MDDLSTTEAERIRMALDERAQLASPPPAYDLRVRRHASWRGMAFVGSAAVVIAALAVGVLVVLPLENGRTTAPIVPASPSPEAPAMPSGELVFTQGAESIQTVTLPDGTVTPAPGGDVETRELEVSPDGRHVAYAIGRGPYQGELRILDLQTGDSETIVADEGTIMSPTWTDYGARIAFIAESYKEDPSIPSFRIGFVRPDGTGMHFVVELVTGAFAVGASPDGSRLVYIDAHSDVQMFDLGTGDTSMLWSRKEGGAADTLALSPTGDQLALAAEGVLYLLPIDHPEALQPVETGLGIFEAAWMPGGDGLILSAEKNLDDDADLYFFDLSTGDVSPLPSTQDDDLAPSVAESGQ